ncbi:MAG: hypothetical protein ACOYM3_02595 [Terrimicrobiaceae bacterium]
MRFLLWPWVGYWLLVIGYWSLVTGHWLLVIGYWSLGGPDGLRCGKLFSGFQPEDDLRGANR